MTLAWYQHERDRSRNADPSRLSPVSMNSPSTSRTLAARPQPQPGLSGLAVKYLDERGLSWRIAQWNGWYTSDTAGDSHPRLVMPATSGVRGHDYWQARALEKGVEPRYQSPRADRLDALIIVNSPGNTKDSVVVTEGPMDALAAAEAGMDGIALMGNNPPEEALALLGVFMGVNNLLIADADALDAMATLLGRIVYLGKKVAMVAPYPYKDLAEAPLAERKRILGL